MKDEYVELEYIILEDGIEYAIVDEITIDNNLYLYLVNNNRNVEIRRQDEQENLIKVNDKNEYDKVMLVFMKKHKNDFSNN